MNDCPEQPPTGGQSHPISEMSVLPLSASRDLQRKTIRSQARWVVPALLLSVCLLLWAIWTGQPFDWENLNLPRVTVEVQGMS